MYLRAGCILVSQCGHQEYNMNKDVEETTKINANLDVLSRRCIHHVGGISSRGTGCIHLRQAGIVVVLVPHHRNWILGVELVRRPFFSDVCTLARIVSRLVRVTYGPGRRRLEESSIKCLIEGCPSAGRWPRRCAWIGLAGFGFRTKSVSSADHARQSKQQLITECQHLNDYYTPLELIESVCWHEAKCFPFSDGRARIYTCLQSTKTSHTSGCSTSKCRYRNVRS